MEFMIWQSEVTHVVDNSDKKDFQIIVQQEFITLVKIEYTSNVT